MKLKFSFLIFFCSAVFAQEIARPIRPPPIPVEGNRIIPKSYFTIVAPYGIRQGYPYNIYIRGFSLSRSTIFRISINLNGTRADGSALNIRRTAVIRRGSTRTSIAIDTKSIPQGTYSLYVESGDFSEKRSLTYVGKSFSLHIFTNKAIFLPGDLLQYKIFSINSETRAVDPKCSSIVTITDGNNNLISSVQNVSFYKGQYGGDFQISSKASLGIWQLQVQCGDEIVSKQIEVAEYTLPLLQATLSVPQTVPSTFGKVTITVDVSYTFGGDANGNATVTIDQWGNELYSGQVNVNGGTATFDVEFSTLRLAPGSFGYYTANLVFFDPLTGNKATDTKSFSVTPFIYRIEPRNSYVLKPGSELPFTIIMKKYDGSPAPAGLTVYIAPSFPATIPSQRLTLGSDGRVSGSINVPVDVNYLSMRVYAKGASDAYISASVRSFGTGEFLNVEVLTEKPKLYERVKLMIRTGEPVYYVGLHIVSKGILLRSTRVFFDDDDDEDNDPKTVEYKFTLSLRHVPNVQVIVYYINSKGNFITGQAHIEVDNGLGNYLTVTPSATTVKPGANVNFEVESYVGSTVSLLAIDQRVLLLKGGNNVTREGVFGDLYRYSSYRVNYDWNNVASYEYSFGSTGLFVFTNIPRPERKYYPRPDRPEAMERPSAPDRSPGKEASDGSDVQVRQDFREVFLWRDVPIRRYKYWYASKDSDDYWKGTAKISEKVPESITTYAIMGVAMSKYDGIGLPDYLPSVTVFLPFFLSVELPYSVKRNEVLLQDIVIFNYLKMGQTVEVRVTKDAKFEAVDLDSYGWKDITGFYTQSVSTTVGQNIKLQFALRPTVLGFAPLEITAKGPLAGDGVKKQLRIIPEGIPRTITRSVFIAIEGAPVPEIPALSCNLPDSAYNDTTEVSATVVGDIFGKALNNLDHLISMPGGCGEQNMLSLAPDISIYQYLQSANLLTVALKSKLEKYIAAGYQNQLRYQRTDGSFSAFGNSDPSGSTWLSAYVGLYFYFARGMTTIDSAIIQRTADFVISQQSKDGSFHEPGRVIHSDMQGASGNGIALTAYCVSFLQTILPDYPQYASALANSVAYLENGFSSNSTTYELAVISYALQLAGSSQATAAFDLFDARRTTSGITTFWSMPAPPNPGYWYSNQPRSLDIEVSAYGLLLYVARNASLGDKVKIAKYLVSKANSFGGYTSSQDTVVAFQALSQFASAFALSTNLNLILTPDIGNSIQAKVDSTNTFTLQTFELNQNARNLDVEVAPGDAGLAIVSLICNFYEDPTKVVPHFNVSSTFKYACKSRITFDACASYIPSGTSNMAIMEITMPSGFVYNQWNSVNNPDVSKVETSNQGSKVTYYFNSFSNKPSCVSVNAYRAKFVAELKGGTIQVFDYYDTSKEGSNAYDVPDISQPCYYSRF